MDQYHILNFISRDTAKPNEILPNFVLIPAESVNHRLTLKT